MSNSVYAESFIDMCTVPVIPLPNSSTSLPSRVIGVLGLCNITLSVTFIVRFDFIISAVMLVKSLAVLDSYSSFCSYVTSTVTVSVVVIVSRNMIVSWLVTSFLTVCSSLKPAFITTVMFPLVTLALLCVSVTFTLICTLLAVLLTIPAVVLVGSLITSNCDWFVVSLTDVLPPYVTFTV